MDAQPHLLVVDDHREIRESLSDYLRQHGYRVSPAESEETRLIDITALIESVCDDLSDTGQPVIGRSRAEQALDPAPWCERAIPRKGEAQTVRSQVSTAGLTAEQMPDDKGHIT